MKTYTIKRFFFKGETEVITIGLTLEEAQAHCSDPETSSRTCSQETLDEIGPGPWFEGYSED